MLATMSNHPNRGPKGLKVTSNPSPTQIRQAREDAGLTLEQAGELVHTSWRTWQNWEADAKMPEHRRMHPATWELAQIKLKALELLKKGRIAPADVKNLGIYLPAKD
jgi:DNA-binding XRE family transcriptional regulator